MNATRSLRRTLRRQLRATFRFAGFLWIVCSALLRSSQSAPRGSSGILQSRAHLLQRVAQRLSRLLDLRVRYIGQPQRQGLLVCNHISYLDILALASRQPVLFVCKEEVRSWPLIGWVARRCGTIFIDRRRRSDVARVAATIGHSLAQGVPVCLFPEGTSSSGTSLLPFRTSLLEPLAGQSWPLTAVWLSYYVERGSATHEIGFWGEMRFLPHFWRLLTHRRIFATVTYQSVAEPARCRKVLGQQLHSIVSRLAHQPSPPGSASLKSAPHSAGARLQPRRLCRSAELPT